ncbi:major facilitator superfamily domain-containing protein [Radiomyces spectabilis]|uniref:major facilitator superfamily domain-containing protein n=1 Tax=Radiomyces spectabilis TaxID=64574 RepID=UPI00221EF165|nr:major facilitator superfamily domain-containing protein [Radiomyces spectabilis]KAI8391752.1 major facilitator superfamily domain-containing protein [Radiomyces spectabilis]
MAVVVDQSQANTVGSSLNGFCSTIYFPGLPELTLDLQASPMAVTLTTSLFILFGGIGPIMWASISDFYHIRRFIYLVSLLIFVAASIGCALVTNVWYLVVLRCIQSIGTSGTIADCWEITERGSAFSFLFLGQFLGPLIGPVAGGGITSGLGWRFTFWFCAAYGVFLFLFLFVGLPETYRLDHVWNTELPVHRELEGPTMITLVRSENDDIGSAKPEDSKYRLGETSSVALTSRSTVSIEPEPKTKLNPFKSIAMLKHMFVWLIAVQTGICFGTMFTIETIIPDLYAHTYRFESWQTGLSFLGAGIGNVLGSFVSGKLSDRLLKRARAQRGGVARAEDRLTLNAWPGGYILVPLGVLLFGWAINMRFSVWVSIVGFAIVCFGMSQVYAAGSAYLVDAIPGKGASVTAASNLFRMSMACILSLVAKPIVDSIGPGYLAVVLAGLNITSMSLYAIVKFKGPVMRSRAGYGDSPL